MIFNYMPLQSICWKCASKNLNYDKQCDCMEYLIDKLWSLFLFRWSFSWFAAKFKVLPIGWPINSNTKRLKHNTVDIIKFISNQTNQNMIAIDKI